MNGCHVCKACWVIVLAAVASGLHWDEVKAATQTFQGEVEAGVQVLTRGPVHEAFAATVTFDPEPGVVVTRPPPEPIEELPPIQRPEGAGVTWIPGYSAWDDERGDYVWLSGVWRAVPPGRQWISGYWGRSGHGFQWISGYWANANLSEIEYLPEPPETVEVGPNIDAPSRDHTWVPGSWIWHQGRYAWRPGYWAAVDPDWVWIPGHYIWSPRGYVFVDGYWDHTIDRRGVLFAPVVFDSSVYAQAGFHYSPRMAIDLSIVTDHLFLRPRYHHYYFGDYYSSAYYDVGIYPSFSFHYGRHGYDPIYAHRRWHHRHDHDWEHQVEARFRYRRDHEEARPARTLAAQLVIERDGTRSRDNKVVLGLSLDRLEKSSDRPIRLVSVDTDERQKMAQRRHEVQKSREERRELETKAAVTPTVEKTIRDSEPTRAKLSKSPIMANPNVEAGKQRTPPKAHDAPNVDPKVEAKPRSVGAKRQPPRQETKPLRADQDEPKQKRESSKQEAKPPKTDEEESKPKQDEKPKQKKKSKDDKDD